MLEKNSVESDIVILYAGLGWVGRAQCLSHSASIPGKKELKRDEETRKLWLCSIQNAIPQLDARVFIEDFAFQAWCQGHWPKTRRSEPKARVQECVALMLRQ